MSDKVVRTFGPVAMAVAAANVYNNTDTKIVDEIRHLHVVNTSG